MVQGPIAKIECVGWHIFDCNSILKVTTILLYALLTV
uniref:Uncharacterized protein n=1 Tax=Arundo donax TaxID=35708 RepID=A0A0A9A1R4_ARUDO